MQPGVSASTFGGCTVDKDRITLEVTDEGLELVYTRATTGSFPPPEGMDCLDYADDPPPDEMFTCTRYERVVAAPVGE